MRALIIVTLLAASCSDSPSDRDARDVGVDLATSPRPDVGMDEDASAETDLGPQDVGTTDAAIEPRSGWVELAPLPAPQQEVAVVDVDGLLYVMGGFSETAQQLATVVVYDPATDRWSARADFPERANHMNATVIDGEIWVTGFLSMGFNPDGRTFVYSPTDDQWRPGPDLPAGRGRGASAVGVIDGLIYVAGGIGQGGATAITDVLDPASGTWTPLANAPRAFDHAGYGVIADKLYVAAGRNGSIASYVPDSHVYDPATDTWSDLQPIPTARGGVASAVLDEKLYVFGGEGDPASPGRVFPQIEAYDPGTNTWSQLEPMRVPRHGLAGAVIRGAIHLPGGAPTEFLDAVDVHDAWIP